MHATLSSCDKREMGQCQAHNTDAQSVATLESSGSVLSFVLLLPSLLNSISEELVWVHFQSKSTIVSPPDTLDTVASSITPRR